MKNSQIIENDTLPLPNKCKNRINEIFKKYTNKKELAELLDQTTVPKYDPATNAKVYVWLPKVIKALYQQENWFTTIDLVNFNNVVHSISEKIAHNLSFDDVAMTIWMWWSLDTPNVRSPSYLVAAIKSIIACKQLNETWIITWMPKVNVFKADHLSSHLNNFNLSAVQEVTKVTFNFLQSFLSEFFPDIYDSFQFYVDDEVSDGLLDELHTQSNILLEQRSAIEKELSSLLQMWQKHWWEQGKQNALLYAAAHPLYNWSLQYSWVDNTSFIIDHWWRPQIVFNELWKVLLNHHNSTWTRQTIPITHAITKSWKIPVYYKARNWDIPLEKWFSWIDLTWVDPSIQQDFKEIYSLVNQHAFVEFVHSHLTSQ